MAEEDESVEPTGDLEQEVLKLDGVEDLNDESEEESNV